MYIQITIQTLTISLHLKGKTFTCNLLEVSDKKQDPHKFLFLLQWSQHHKDFPPLLCHDFYKKVHQQN